MIETQVLRFRLPKPETETKTTTMAMGMTFLDHQDSKVSIINDSKVGVFEKDSGVPNRKRLIIKFRIPNTKALKNNQQDSKPINKNSGYCERVRNLLTESFSRVSSETDERISPSINPVQLAATDPKNPDLRRKMLLGEIKPESLVNMSTEEMASHKRQSENIQIHLKRLKRCVHDADEEENATTDTFQCIRCHERKCTYYQM
ncbi:transcription elongation factor TFIIS [Quercus suber]|uniref:transcription elongation factor TFIIS n=1 Tax=Quercus suber TaxID=58331 RepID=UPI0032E02E19